LNCSNLLIINWDRDEEIVKNNCNIHLIPAWKWLIFMDSTN